jgi:NDP-sugar pyrophosphorylase family protein
VSDPFANVTAAILAGGLGTRLRSVVADRPKVLAPVGGRPYLSYLLDQLAGAPVREVVLLTGHRAEQVRAVMGEAYRGMCLHYSEEPTPLGTAGAVRQALPLFRSGLVLLMNGDSYCDVDLGVFHEFHCRQAADVSLTLSRVSDTARFGRVRLAADGRVERFEEKGGAGGEGWINAGVYLIDRRLIAALPPAMPLSLERDLFPNWVQEHRVFGYQGGGRFIDIGTPESYAEAEAFFDQGAGFRLGEPGA